ncbi:MAG: hypothetical protein AAF205_11880 [Pseudomonadota bacterium]
MSTNPEDTNSERQEAMLLDAREIFQSSMKAKLLLSEELIWERRLEGWIESLPFEKARAVRRAVV